MCHPLLLKEPILSPTIQLTLYSVLLLSGNRIAPLASSPSLLLFYFLYPFSLSFPFFFSVSFFLSSLSLSPCLSLPSLLPCLPSQVNGQNIEEMTHEEAAACLKGAGTVVTMVVEYQPNEYEQFQQKLLRKSQVCRAAGMEDAVMSWFIYFWFTMVQCMHRILTCMDVTHVNLCFLILWVQTNLQNTQKVFAVKISTEHYYIVPSKCSLVFTAQVHKIKGGCMYAQGKCLNDNHPCAHAYQNWPLHYCFPMLYFLAKQG